MDGGNNKKYYKDYYATLCVSRAAPLGEIDAAYQDCIASVRGNELDDIAKDAMTAEIDEAYRCLADGVSRRAYDDSCAAYYKVFTEERQSGVTSRSVSREHITLMFADIEHARKKKNASAKTFRRLVMLLVTLIILFIGGTYYIRLQSFAEQDKPRAATNGAAQPQTKVKVFN
ncbi:hypothetical protein FACS1894216_12240 [Synergistales bacterium]|nr:hypothetical protein FACS1894216_12240 [Synergistales bacterium]